MMIQEQSVETSHDCGMGLNRNMFYLNIRCQEIVYDEWPLVDINIADGYLR